MRLVRGIAPDPVSLGTDHGLHVLDPEGELPPAPGAGGYDGIDTLRCIGTDDIVSGRADRSLQRRDIGVARCRGRVAVVRADDRAHRGPVSGPTPHAAAVRLRARSAGAGVEFNRLYPSAVIGLNDSDVVGDAVVVPVEANQVSGRCLGHGGDESAFARGCVDPVGDIGEVPAGQDRLVLIVGRAP
ncbi:hypothetical protein HMPREF1505_1735 [Prevotella sp. ICM33]|nr:hypothetical protein HMPREF1505_1735 [Prevotella sp. ICM33]